MRRSRFSRALGASLASAALSGLFGVACTVEEGRDTSGRRGTQSPTGQSDLGLEVCGVSEAGSPMLRRLNAREFQATLKDVFPEVDGAWTSTLSTDPISHFGYDNEAERLVVGRQTAREIDETAASVAAAVSGAALTSLLPCAATAADRVCAEAFLDKYGKRLFRRSLSAEEKATLLAFFDEAAGKTSFAQGIGWLTRALIHSPHTVYRREIGVLEGEERALTQHEIAAALSYTFAGTTPSDDLLARADAGELSSPEVLVEVARELLGTPGGRENLHYLFGAWLGYPRVTTVAKVNDERFETLRADMREETRRFIELVILDGNGNLDALLTSPLTTPSQRLAEFYGEQHGFPVPGSDYAAVERPEHAGVGILAQGSVLATRASAANSSPTQRGLLVMENFLCRTPPTVPPDVPDLATPPEGTAITTRQRYEELHSTGACKNCHMLFDPIGFGFEHFDELGRYRADEGPSLPIDATGHVVGPGAEFSFDGQAELAAQLAQQAEVQACVSARVKAYAFGAEESCLGESQRDAFMDGAIGFVDYILSLAAEPHFVSRSSTIR